MRILYLITKSEAGGAQTHVAQLSKAMTEAGNEVAVMSQPGGWLEEEIQNPKSEIRNKSEITNSKFQTANRIKFYPNPFFENSMSPFLGFKAMKEIRLAVKDFKPDIISCHSSVAGFWGRLAVRNKIPTIFTAHGWGFTPGLPQKRKSIAIIAEKIAALFCSKIICVSEFDRQLALKHKITKEDKLKTIHNGVETHPHSLVKKSYLKKKEFDMNHATMHFMVKRYEKRNPREIAIIFVGRLSAQKDPELLIESFAELPEDLRSAGHIFIVGGGEKMEKLNQMVDQRDLNDRITFLGEINRRDVLEKLGESDVFVLTSHYEGFPRSILEAMSYGLPVIASDVGGVSEAVDEEVGYLVKRGDKKGVKKALAEIIKNPEILDTKGENAQKRAEENFSLEKMIRETREIYEDSV